jgi:hypothetical protein
MAKPHRNFVSLSDEEMIEFVSKNYPNLNRRRRRHLADLDQSLYVILKKRNLLDRLFPIKGGKGRKLSEEQRRGISLRNSVPRKYPPEVLRGIAWDYAYFDDSIEEICQNYGVPNKSQVSGLIRKAVGMRVVANEEYSNANRRRVSYNSSGEMNGNSKIGQRDEELLEIVIQEVRDYQRGRLKKLSNNSKLAKEYEVLSISTIYRHLKRLPEDIKEYRRRAIIIQSSKERMDNQGSPAQEISYEERKRLVDFVVNEFEMFQRGEADSLSKNSELAKKLGVCSASVSHYLRDLPLQIRKTREKIIKQLSLGSSPLEGFTEDELKDLRTKAYRNGLGKISYEQRVQIGIEASKVKRENNYFFRNNFYDSRTEAACAAMLEKYIPGFEIKEGETFQVNGGCLYDFNLEQILLEWHPINIHYDGERYLPEDWEAYKELKDLAKTKEERNALRYLEEQFKEDLAVEYWMERQESSDNSQVYQGKEVVLARTAGELYDEVLTKYGEDIPSKRQFYREFYDVVKQVKPVGKKEELIEVAAG